jgi:formate--tetrahydrofolate ligase
MKRYGVPVVVAINQFTADTIEELNMVKAYAAKFDVPAYIADVWSQGGDGAQELATGVVLATDKAKNYQPLYQPDDEALVKIEHIVHEIYGGQSVVLSDKAVKQLQTFKKYGWDKLPIIMAKTQYSLSDNPNKIGAPENFDIHIREFIPKLGAGFLVALTGSVLTMPGLPKHPAALDIDIDNEGHIIGLN